MNQSGLKRALRYFIRQAEIYVLLIFAGSFVMAGYQRLVTGDSMKITEILQMVPEMIACLTTVVIFVMGAGDGRTWYSMLISFGCRRKHVFWGSLVMFLLVAGESLVLIEVTSLILNAGNLSWLLPLMAAIFLIVEGISQLIGVVAVKWGRAVYAVMLVLMVLLILISIGIGMFVMVVFRGAQIQAVFLDKCREPLYQAGILLAGAAVCILSNAVTYRLLSDFEVRV